MLSCSLQNSKIIGFNGLQKYILWRKRFSWDLRWKWISDVFLHCNYHQIRNREYHLHKTGSSGVWNDTSAKNGRIPLNIGTLVLMSIVAEKTRRSENDNTPQPLDQWTNSPFIGQQVGNCKSFTLTHYLADLFAMHRGPRSISLCIQHHIQLTSLSFQVSRPSHS